MQEICKAVQVTWDPASLGQLHWALFACLRSQCISGRLHNLVGGTENCSIPSHNLVAAQYTENCAIFTQNISGACYGILSVDLPMAVCITKTDSVAVKRKTVLRTPTLNMTKLQILREVLCSRIKYQIWPTNQVCDPTRDRHMPQ